MSVAQVAIFELGALPVIAARARIGIEESNALPVHTGVSVRAGIPIVTLGLDKVVNALARGRVTLAVLLAGTSRTGHVFQHLACPLGRAPCRNRAFVSRSGALEAVVRLRNTTRNRVARPSKADGAPRALGIYRSVDARINVAPVESTLDPVVTFRVLLLVRTLLAGSENIRGQRLSCRQIVEEVGAVRRRRVGQNPVAGRVDLSNHIGLSLISRIVLRYSLG